MFTKFVEMFKHKEVRERIIFTLGILFVFKLGTIIVVPGVDNNLSNWDSGGIFGLIDLLGGGALQQFSIFALGVTPYITASIIIQLLSMDVLPKLSELAKQGEYGRRKLNDATRYLTLVLAAVQAYGILVTLQAQGLTSTSGGSFGFGEYVYICTILVAGSMFLMWLGDQITQKGIGNGVSIIIFGGIIAGIPNQIQQGYNFFVDNDATGAFFNGIISFSMYLLIMLAIVVFVVFIEKSMRKVPVQYPQSEQTETAVSYLPIKLNSAGVIPVIFASSIMVAPVTISSFIDRDETNSFVQSLKEIFSLSEPYKGIYWGLLIYIGLIVLCSFFYANMQIDSQKISDSFQKSGSYIPGVRPGTETKKYIFRIVNRLTFLGAIYLALVAGLPFLAPILIDGLPASIAFGGTGLIIIIGVALETTEQLTGKLAGQSLQPIREGE